MSYCSWCGERGHNSASCADRKKWLAPNPNTYEAAYEAAKVARRKARKQNPRKCGFCKKTGHNVKTCTLKQTIHKKFAALNSVFRRTVLEQLCTQGVGVGALVNLTIHGRTRSPSWLSSGRLTGTTFTLALTVAVTSSAWTALDLHQRVITGLSIHSRLAQGILPTCSLDP